MGKYCRQGGYTDTEAGAERFRSGSFQILAGPEVPPEQGKRPQDSMRHV